METTSRDPVWTAGYYTRKEVSCPEVPGGTYRTCQDSLPTLCVVLRWDEG